MMLVGDAEGRVSEGFTVSGVSWHIILTNHLNAMKDPSHKNTFCLYVRHTNGALRFLVPVQTFEQTLEKVYGNMQATVLPIVVYFWR